MDRISRATDIDHVELVPAAVSRAYFETEGIRPGTEISLVIETENVGDDTEASITVFAEDDSEFELDALTGQISSNRLRLQYTPLDGVDDETALKESLGNDLFRTFRFRVRIESLDVDYDSSDNTLSIGLPGVVIEGIDEQFAPHEEQLEIRYRFIDILNEIQGARIRIYASNYEDNNYPDSGALIYSDDILADDRPHDVTRTYRWYGNTTAESGPLQQPGGELVYVTPLFSPYTVEIVLSTENEDPGADSDAKINYKRIDEEENEVDWQFQVAYHSIELELGEHIDLDHAPAPDSTEWAQWRLNDLGYPCGPADGIEGDMTERGVKNFQRANWQVPWPEDAEADRTPLEVNGDVDDATRAVMQSRTQVERRRMFSSVDDLFDPGAAVKLYTWTNMFYSFQADVEDGEQEWDDSNRDEWWDSRFNPRMFPRHEKEALVLNRPWVPIIAKVMLKNRSGEAIFCPWGVGNVRVNFSVNDPPEDMEITSSDAASAPRRYVDGARQQINTATGDNCPEDHAGVRVEDQNENYKKYLHIGDNLDPYESQDDSSRHVVYVEAPLEGRGRGSAGIYFIPSYNAGDNFKLRAEMDFQDHPNRENIEPESGPFRAETATITNWRKMKVAAFLSFCTRQAAAEVEPSFAERITAGLGEFENAYIEYEDPVFNGEVTDFLTEDEYTDLVCDLYNLTTPAERATVRFRPRSSIYGFDMRQQNAGEAPGAYRSYLRSTAEAFCDRVLEPLGKIIINNVRKRCREGSVVIDFQSHEPATIYNDRGAATESVAENNYRASTYAVGLHNGLVYLDIVLNERLDMDFSYLLAHEIGHTVFLYHWENTDTNTLSNAGDYENPVNFRVNPTHHDHNDSDCIMSYPLDFHVFPDPPPGLVLDGTPINNVWDYVAYVQAEGETHRRHHQLAVNYRPNFCGKCLLKLRGWNVYTLPQSY
jgi:hypothetical protein